MLDYSSPDLKALVGKFRRFGRAQREAADRVFESNAKGLREAVIRNASGRPGPNRVTGTYVNSITVRRRRMAGGSVWSVGTDDPRARRLELGFHGTDSDGRVYNQPPYPHWLPAIEEVMPLVVAEAGAATMQTWEES